jgi:hypothetical protein
MIACLANFPQYIFPHPIPLENELSVSKITTKIYVIATHILSQPMGESRLKRRVMPFRLLDKFSNTHFLPGIQCDEKILTETSSPGANRNKMAPTAGGER